MKHEIIKGFTKFINENYSDESADNSVSPKQHNSNLDRLHQLGIVYRVATAYSGNSNEEMLRLTFSDRPGKEVLIGLDSLANVLDASVLDANSDEDQEAINQALWTRAQEIAKRAGCSVLIDNESDTEIDLTGRASNRGYNENRMDNMSDMDHENGQMLSHADGTESPEHHSSNLDRLRQLGIADHEWDASMFIDFDYLYNDTPTYVKSVFMDHAENVASINIDLTSVDIDDWTEEDTRTTDEDGEIEDIDYGFSALIYFTFTTDLTDPDQIKDILENSFPNNVFMYVQDLERV